MLLKDQKTQHWGDPGPRIPEGSRAQNPGGAALGLYWWCPGLHPSQPPGEGMGAITASERAEPALQRAAQPSASLQGPGSPTQSPQRLSTLPPHRGQSWVGGTGGVAFRSCKGAGPRLAHSGGCRTASFTAQEASRAAPSPPPPLCPSACAARTRRAVPRPGECSRPRGGAQASLVEEWGRRVGVLLCWCGKGCAGRRGRRVGAGAARLGGRCGVRSHSWPGARGRACVEMHAAGAQAAPARCGWDAQGRRGRVRGAGQRAPSAEAGKCGPGWGCEGAARPTGRAGEEPRAAPWR